MAKWVLEPGHTAAEFRVRHMMVTYIRGSFKNVHGTLCGYRDLINAANCKAAVLDNSVSNFRRVAINVGKPTAPPRVFGNVAYSGEPGDKAVSVQGSTGQTLDNELRSPRDAEKPMFL